jgi:hypothetical protein
MKKLEARELYDRAMSYGKAVREAERLMDADPTLETVPSDAVRLLFDAQPLETIIRATTARIDKYASPFCPDESDKERLREMIETLKEFFKKMEDDDGDDDDLDLYSLNRRHKSMIAQAISAAYLAGCLSLSRQNEKAVTHMTVPARMRKRKAAKSATVRGVIASIWRVNANKNLSGKAMIGLAHEELKKKKLRVPSDTTIYRYLAELKS